MRRLAGLAVGVALAASACSAGEAVAVRRIAGTAPSPSVSPRSTPTRTPATPTVTGPPRATQGTVITPTGAILEPVSGPVVTSAPPEADCQALVDEGWIGMCGRESMAGGTVIWVAEHRPVPTGCCDPWIAQVSVYSAAAGGWFPTLRAQDLRGISLAGVTLVATDLTGDGRPELVAGFRFQGTGFVLGTDIVTYEEGGSPTVSAHPNEADHGSVVVATGRLDEYSAQRPNGEPECCPAYFLHRVISWDGRAFRATVVGRVATAPRSDL